MEYFFGFVILLGVLIFIHELGHFSVAKLCGMRVEIFSIGMGKRLFSFQKGETLYALSILPIGGYVKITGQDPREEVPAELAHRSFRDKPLSQRSAVVLAGPIFNAVLAALIFIFLYAVGVPKLAPIYGRVLENSAAHKAGFRSGDIVKQIQLPNQSVENILEYADLERVVGDATGKELKFEVTRGNETQAEKTYISFTPKLGAERDSSLGVIKMRGVVEGAERDTPASVIGILSKNTWAGQRDIPLGFYIEELSFTFEGVEKIIKTENFFELQDAWKQAVMAQTSSPNGQVKLKGSLIEINPANANKGGETTPSPLTRILSWTQTEDRPSENILATGIISSELVIIEVKPNTPAEKLGLKIGDLLTALNNQPIQSFASFRHDIQTLAQEQKPIKLSWKRNGEDLNAEVLPEKVSSVDPMTEIKSNQFQIGAAFMALPAASKLITVKADNFLGAINLGLKATYQNTATMVGSFYHLLSGNISPKTLGGPILIGKVAGESFKRGYASFLKMMAFISLNLFILNLLPVPVLDGGHLILFAIEAIRRKPLSIKIIEVWTTAGFFLLMGLIAIVFFNDLSRLGLFKIFSS